MTSLDDHSDDLITIPCHICQRDAPYTPPRPLFRPLAFPVFPCRFCDEGLCGACAEGGYDVDCGA